MIIWWHPAKCQVHISFKTSGSVFRNLSCKNICQVHKDTCEQGVHCWIIIVIFFFALPYGRYLAIQKWKSQGPSAVGQHTDQRANLARLAVVATHSLLSRPVHRSWLWTLTVEIFFLFPDSLRYRWHVTFSWFSVPQRNQTFLPQSLFIYLPLPLPEMVSPSSSLFILQISIQMSPPQTSLSLWPYLTQSLPLLSTTSAYLFSLWYLESTSILIYLFVHWYRCFSLRRM